jgi:hypothetical protein
MTRCSCGDGEERGARSEGLTNVGVGHDDHDVGVGGEGVDEGREVRVFDLQYGAHVSAYVCVYVGMCVCMCVSVCVCVCVCAYVCVCVRAM